MTPFLTLFLHLFGLGHGDRDVDEQVANLQPASRWRKDKRARLKVAQVHGDLGRDAGGGREVGIDGGLCVEASSFGRVICREGQ